MRIAGAAALLRTLRFDELNGRQGVRSSSLSLGITLWVVGRTAAVGTADGPPSAERR